jgi:hypothetical protein
MERAARVTGAVSFARQGLQTLVLANGGAMIGAMTFVGHVWSGSAQDGADLARLVFIPMALFIAGLITALAANLLAYISQYTINDAAVRGVSPQALALRPL